MGLYLVEDFITDPKKRAEMKAQVDKLTDSLNVAYGPTLGVALFQMIEIMRTIKPLSRAAGDMDTGLDMSKQMVSIWATLRNGPATDHSPGQAKYLVGVATHEFMEALRGYESIIDPILNSIDFNQAIEVIIMKPKRKKGGEDDPERSAGYLNLW